jgi:putrescine transport system permease protein
VVGRPLTPHGVGSRRASGRATALRAWQRVGVAIPYTWLLVFFLAPFLMVLKISLADPVVAQPPYTPLLAPGAGSGGLHVTLEDYRFVLGDGLYRLTYLSSLELAAVSTLLCLLIGYPMAYGIARARPDTRSILLLLVLLPFWISFLLRVYAWMGILSSRGVLNGVLLWAGLIERPLEILYSDTAVFLGMVYSYLPFMVLPLYANLERLDLRLLEAASDLGARPRHVFFDVTLPLSLPGVVAGCLLVFIPAMGEFVIPTLLGGPESLMIGRVLYEEFFANRDWPVAAADTVLLLTILLAPIGLFQYFESRREEAAEGGAGREDEA